MNFGQEPYDRYLGTDTEEAKLPFYMTYPMKNSFLEEAEYERDCRRLQQLYPRDARRVQELVAEACDKMEYEGSLMFDEYPDRLMLRLICTGIYRKMKDDDTGTDAVMERDDPLGQLIGVMLVQEMYRRRCRYRRCRRWY